MRRWSKLGLVVCGVIPSTLIAATALAVQPVVAVHVSENTPATWRYLNWRYFHPYQFLEEALRADGTPFVELTDAQIAGDSLIKSGVPQYPILISLAAEAVSDTEVSQLRAYVNAGGHLYAGSSSFTRDQSGSLRLDANKQPTFALASEMGLTGGGWTRITRINNASPQADLIEDLPAGNTEWTMPLRYNYVDVTNQNVRNVLRHMRPHWIWMAKAAASAPATPLLTAQLDANLDQSYTNPAVLASAESASFHRYADVDGDGRTDLAYRINGTVFVQLSSGQGLLPAVSWTAWGTNYSYDLADVNGDGKADIIGRLQNSDDVEVGLSTGSSFAPSTQWTHWDPAYDMSFADVDADGDADIIGRLIGGDDVEVGRSNRTSFTASTRWTNWSPTYDMYFADMDGDGDADVVGRSRTAGQDDVQVGLSNGTTITSSTVCTPTICRFAPSTKWTNWDKAYTTDFADMNGDRRADIVGRKPNVNAAAQVGLSAASGCPGGATGCFLSSTAWTSGSWSSDYTFSLADVNGDRNTDAVGVYTGSAAGTPRGDVQVSLSGGSSASTSLELAVKNFGLGKFIYNAELVPLAGYGGYPPDNFEYRTIRVAIEQAFTQRWQTPLVTLAPWPFRNRAALIFRHDHVVAAEVHASERQLAGASAAQPFGEYYVQPELSNSPLVCGNTNDYAANLNSALRATPSSSPDGLLGAHLINHLSLDVNPDITTTVTLPTDCQALIGTTVFSPQNLLSCTLADMNAQTTFPRSAVFTAPNYQAVQRAALVVLAANFVTTGEQGVGPFPHFTMDPDSPTAHMGTLLQLPTSEWPGGRDNFERLVNISAIAPHTIDDSAILDAARLAYNLGGLINVYDHLGETMYSNFCDASTRGTLAIDYLDFATSLPRVWVTNSLRIRDWWLRRDTRTIDTSATGVTFTHTASSATLDVKLLTRNLQASTPASINDLALRITLDTASQALLAQGVQVTLDGASQPILSCADNELVSCASDCVPNAEASCRADELFVRVGAATHAVIRLGPP